MNYRDCYEPIIDMFRSLLNKECLRLVSLCNSTIAVSNTVFLDCGTEDLLDALKAQETYLKKVASTLGIELKIGIFKNPPSKWQQIYTLEQIFELADVRSINVAIETTNLYDADVLWDNHKAICALMSPPKALNTPQFKASALMVACGRHIYDCTRNFKRWK